jgi:hypothetical protein
MTRTFSTLNDCMADIVANGYPRKPWNCVCRFGKQPSWFSPTPDQRESRWLGVNTDHTETVLFRVRHAGLKRVKKLGWWRGARYTLYALPPPHALSRGEQPFIALGLHFVAGSKPRTAAIWRGRLVDWIIRRAARSLPIFRSVAAVLSGP